MRTRHSLHRNLKCCCFRYDYPSLRKGLESSVSYLREVLHCHPLSLFRFSQSCAIATSCFLFSWFVSFDFHLGSKVRRGLGSAGCQETSAARAWWRPSDMRPRGLPPSTRPSHDPPRLPTLQKPWSVIGAYLIFVLFSPHAQFLAQFFSTPKRVNTTKQSSRQNSVNHIKERFCNKAA